MWPGFHRDVTLVARLRLPLRTRRRETEAPRTVLRRQEAVLGTETKKSQEIQRNPKRKREISRKMAQKECRTAMT